MEKQKPQSFEHHTRNVPAFQIGLFVLLFNLGSTLYRLRFGVAFRPVLSVVVAATLIVMFISARVFAVTVQDRVIRLEMRLRLAEILPPDLKPRIQEFTVSQLVALRFASDSELPALSRKVLDEKLDDRKAIKRLVKDWQADYLRA